MKHFLLATFLLVTPQTLNVTIPPNTPFVIEWQYPVVNVTDEPKFRWWCNNTIVKNFVAADLEKTLVVDMSLWQYSATVPGLPSGSHNCQIGAYNVVGEVKSDMLSVPAGSLPAKPSNVTIRIVVKM